MNCCFWPNLVDRVGVDWTDGVCAGPGAVGELWRVGDRVGLARGLFPPDPSYQRDGGRRFRLRQQRRSHEVLELLREVGVTQEYVGPKRASMIRVDHHRTPASSQHQLGRGQFGNAVKCTVLKFSWDIYEYPSPRLLHTEEKYFKNVL